MGNDQCHKLCVIASKCCGEASGAVISVGTSQIMIAVPGAADSMAIKHDTSMGQGEPPYSLRYPSRGIQGQKIWGMGCWRHALAADSQNRTACFRPKAAPHQFHRQSRLSGRSPRHSSLRTTLPVSSSQTEVSSWAPGLITKMVSTVHPHAWVAQCFSS